MKNKLIQFIPAVLALAAIGFSYFSQWCTVAGQICFRTLLDQMFPYIISPLYFFSLFFLPISIFLIFIPRRVFNSWLKFAMWTVPLLFIFVVSQPVYATHIFSTDRDDAARLAGGIFSSVSLLLIIWKLIRYRKNSNASGNMNSNTVISSTKSFSSSICAPLMVSVLLILFALQMPWNGGLSSDGLAATFGCLFIVSAYALTKGFYLIWKRGLVGWSTFMWIFAILSAITTASIIFLLGFGLFGVTFMALPFSDFVLTIIFAVLLVFQTLYFVSEAFRALKISRTNLYKDWRFATYFFILAGNAAVLILGPLAIKYLF